MKVIVAPPELMGHPDVLAMLAAFYSRSHESIESRLQKLSEGTLSVDRVKASLKQYYVNYSHESIGDCGEIYLFIEGVSFITAKAIQDHPLYNGQETSSRYINFATQPTPDYVPPHAGHEEWMTLYRAALPEVYAAISQDASILESGRHPKTFDIVRGLLPVTGATQLSWNGSIRTIRNHLASLLAHPNPIVVRDAAQILHAVQEVFPDLYEGVEAVDDHEWYIDRAADLAGGGFYAAQANWNHLGSHQQSKWEGARNTIIGYNSDWCDVRAESTHLPRYGVNSILNSLDFAGYRDVQRHRRSYTRAEDPMVARGGLHDWYMERLPSHLHGDIEALYRESQITPLANIVAVSQTQDLVQARYYVNMRTKPAVHATVRRFSAENGETIYAHYPNLEEARLFEINRDGTDYNRRGKQTIFHNGAAI